MKTHVKVMAAVTAMLASGIVGLLTSHVHGKEPRFAQLTLEQTINSDLSAKRS